MSKVLSTAICFSSFALMRSLDNGLARMPPMGWMTWERFRCTTDCKDDPDNCVNDRLLRQHASMMHDYAHPSYGTFVQAGYNRINIDDCWSEMERKESRMVPDQERFPTGMRELAEDLRAKQIRLGIYTDIGVKTCSGYPGICGDENCTSNFFTVDAKSFADWHIDMVKVDGCNSVHTREVLDHAYVNLGEQLNATGRPMLYSCSWPDYIRTAGIEVNYSKVAEHCNIWRMYNDIQDSWESVVGIADWVGDNQDIIQKFARPGAWNDMDALIIGNFALSKTQMRAQMAIWCIAASPLMMGNDLRSLSTEATEVLLNREVIAVNQQTTPAGRRIVHNTTFYHNHDIWMRHMAGDAIAVGIWNRCIFGTHMKHTLKWSDIGLHENTSMAVRNLWNHEDLGCMTGSYSPFVDIDDVLLLKLTPCAILGDQHFAVVV